jgi:hypothetical protein
VSEVVGVRCEIHITQCVTRRAFWIFCSVFGGRGQPLAKRIKAGKIAADKRS